MEPFAQPGRVAHGAPGSPHACGSGAAIAWGPLADRLAFANLCASLSVQEVGGSLAAPGWGDIADWWRRVSAERDGIRKQWLRRYAFLEDIVSHVPAEAVRRASATIATQSDA